jgi:hypothetical protein
MKLKYPILAKLKDDGNADKAVGTVVLFSSSQTGRVLKSNVYPFYHYSNSWINVHDNDSWQIIDSKKKTWPPDRVI